jgi:sugar phosphate isomerase/epimerase
MSAGAARRGLGEIALRLGLSTAAFYGKRETEEAAALLSDMDLDCCEVFLETYSEYTPAFARRVRAALGGLPVHSVHPMGTQFEPALFGKSARQRADARKVLEDVLTVGEALGAKVYVFHGLPDHARSGEGPRVATHLDALRDLCARAADHGMVLGWENVWWCRMSTPAHAAQVRAGLPQARFVLDIKQALRAEEDPLAFVPAMGDALVNLHLCDADATGALCLPGRGTYGFTALFSALAAGGYEGPALLEPYASLFDEPGELRQALAALRGAMAAARIE